MTQFVLQTLGLNDYRVRLGFRDPDSSKYVGDPANWEKAIVQTTAAGREGKGSL